VTVNAGAAGAAAAGVASTSQPSVIRSRRTAPV